jgi:hypothetical protein
MQEHRPVRESEDAYWTVFLRFHPESTLEIEGARTGEMARTSMPYYTSVEPISRTLPATVPQPSSSAISVRTHANLALFFGVLSL